MEECKVDKVLMVVQEAIVDNGLILNYSATMHMFTEKIYLKSLKFKKPGHFITVGGHN